MAGPTPQSRWCGGHPAQRRPRPGKTPPRHWENWGRASPATSWPLRGPSGDEGFSQAPGGFKPSHPLGGLQLVGAPAWSPGRLGGRFRAASQPPGPISPERKPRPPWRSGLASPAVFGAEAFVPAAPPITPSASTLLRASGRVSRTLQTHSRPARFLSPFSR